MIKSLLEALSGLPDPRREHPNRLHKLIDIVVIAVCATIAKCEGWEEVEDYGKEKEAFFRKFLALPNGIPSHDTFNRVFSVLNPLAWQRCFVSWMRSMSELSRERLVAIDGKSLRGSKSSGSGKRDEAKGALAMVSAWMSENQLVLAQLAVPEGGNEIVVIPDLLELLDLQGATVTIDAIGCQKEVAAKIVAQGGEYLLALKANQKTLFNAVQDLFADQRKQGVALDQAETLDIAHGREERRNCWVIHNVHTIEQLKLADCDLQAWPGLNSVVMIESHTIRQGKPSWNRRWFLSSLKCSATEALGKARRHWSIENQQHYPLDVVFHEDASRTRKGFAAQNLAVLRRLCLNLLNLDPTPKLSKRRKRLKALLNDSFLLSLLGIHLSH
jgi:predicted transposase YbfD/YdcC